MASSQPLPSIRQSRQGPKPATGTDSPRRFGFTSQPAAQLTPRRGPLSVLDGVPEDGRPVISDYPLIDGKVELEARARALNDHRRVLLNTYDNVNRFRRHIDLAPIPPPFVGSLPLHSLHLSSVLRSDYWIYHHTY